MVQIYRKAAKVSLASPDITSQIIELEQLKLFRELMAGRSPQKAPRAKRPRESQIERATGEILEFMEARQRFLRAVDKIDARKNPYWAVLGSPFVQAIVKGAMPGLVELRRDLIREKLSTLSSGDLIDESVDSPLLPSKKPIEEDEQALRE